MNTNTDITSSITTIIIMLSIDVLWLKYLFFTSFRLSVYSLQRVDYNESDASDSIWIILVSHQTYLNNNVSLKQNKKFIPNGRGANEMFIKKNYPCEAPLRIYVTVSIILTSNKTKIQNNTLQYNKHKTVKFEEKDNYVTLTRYITN